MDTFRIGDKAVYPGRGVAEVVAIEKKMISGQEMNFYVLQPLDERLASARIFIPTSNVSSVGMRTIISEDEADEIFKILKKREKVVDSTTWNRRHREYREKVDSGSIYEVARVLRDLYLLKSDKDLSFGERKMLDDAKILLLKELAIAKGMTEDEIENQLRSIFKL